MSTRVGVGEGLFEARADGVEARDRCRWDITGGVGRAVGGEVDLDVVEFVAGIGDAVGVFARGKLTQVGLVTRAEFE